MKVLLVNGSPNGHNTTEQALKLVAESLNACGVETEIFWIGRKPIGGCVGCKGCRKTGKCVMDDEVNAFAEKAKSADGFVFGSPVHYAALSGNMTAFMDRLFYSAGSSFVLKPAAAVVATRRAGTTAAFDQMNKYFSITQMPIVSSTYWNMIHGLNAEEAMQDAEGVACMRQLGRNMAYLLRCQQAAKEAGVPMPEQGEPVRTNFIH